MREAAEKQAHAEALRHQQEQEEEEAHRAKYAIVEKIKQEMAMKDAKKEMNVVDSYAAKAQAEFM